MSDSYFSKSYAEARSRFRDAAAAIGAEVFSYPIDADVKDELAIDVALIGLENAPAVVVSSGVHGVEGFLGSAVQLALLDRLCQSTSPSSIRYVLIHSLNPFGFSRLRRVNENNVDLNRNFLASSNDFAGAPKGYAVLDRFLNPPFPPLRFEPFYLTAMWYICRYGLQSLKQSVAGGQYEYPRGLFFGGHGPCKSTRVVQENCDSWLGSSERIVHIDFHSGLGRFGTYQLLLTEGLDSESYRWYAETFGPNFVQPLADPRGTAYQVSGLFGEWMQTHFIDREYRFAGAEFGTYDVIRVLGSLRAENRMHHFGSEDSVAYRSAKKELLECFCPSAPAWRRQVVESGIEIIEQSARGM